MQIKRMELVGVLRHNHTKVVFPDAGVVLVTGKNGSGKSTLIEAPALCLWGSTLRKTHAWSGDSGRVVVEAGGHLVERIKKSKVSLVIDGTKYTRATEGAKLLAQHVGSLDLWRRAHVFASRDANRFTTAPDAERKRMLEALLGLDRFEPALKACRADLRVAERGAASARTAAALAAQRLEAAQQRLADAEQVLAEESSSTDITELEARRDEIQAKVKALVAREVETQQLLRRAEQRVWETQAALKHAEAHARALEGSTCGHCKQTIGAAAKKAAEQDLRVAKAAAAAVQVAADVEVAELRASLAKIKTRLSKGRTAFGAASSAVDRAREAAQVAAGREAQRRKLAEEVLDLQDACDESAAAADDLSAALAELEATEGILSTQGVRAHLLGAALDSIEEVANVWLGRVGTAGELEMKLHLAAASEAGDGSLKDSISLEVEGAGGGYGYHAASSGEQRRIDVALMLALAEMAEGAHGVSGGTLFFDEVFDALDDDGIDAMRQVIHELAQERCIVVITHSKAMKDTLRPYAAEHWHVEDGKIKRRK